MRVNKSYGLKFIENIVHANGRDILAYTMRSLSDYRFVGHVRDEVIPDSSTEASVEGVYSLVGRTPLWLPGIKLLAVGYECWFCMKK